MQLKIPPKDFDLRRQIGRGRQVIDEDTGKSVGTIEATHNHGTRIYLFGDKYKAQFNTYDECIAFAKGVEAVLNHMVSAPSEPAWHDAFGQTRTDDDRERG